LEKSGYVSSVSDQLVDLVEQSVATRRHLIAAKASMESLMRFLTLSSSAVARS
jgi:hypothetical protein